MEADSGTPLEVAWSVEHPDDFGNCTISLNDGIEDEDGHDYEPLIPGNSFGGDKKKQEDAKTLKGAHYAATFPCGRKVAALEGAIVHLPRNMSCDSCVI